MEHRLDIRKSIRLSVRINDDYKTLGSFQTLNISDGGICVEDPCNLLHVGDYVLVNLSLEAENKVCKRLKSLPPRRLQDCTIYALVVHKNAEGTGLMWADQNHECGVLLGQIINAAA